MRFRTTILLILVLIGLGAYVYWVELPKAEQEAKKKTLFEFKADDAIEVSLAYPDHELIVKKSGDEWRLVKPMDAPADATTVKNLVSAIADCEVKKAIEDTTPDLAQYGLDKPFVTVTVKLKDQELPAVLVGKNTPVGVSTYVKKADDPKVLLASSAFRSGMDKKPKDLRDKTILNFGDNDVQKVGIQGDGKDIRLVQKGDSWSLDQPAAYPADSATIRTFLSTLRSMRAVDFADELPSDPSTYGLDAPRLRITLFVGKDNAEQRVLIGKDTDKKEVYVQTSGRPTVYTVSDWVFRDLNKTVADFRDKTLLAFDREKVTGVVGKRKDGTQFKLVRGDDKQWRVDATEGKPAETTISQYIGDLHDLKGYEIAADSPGDLSTVGLDQPQLALTVIGEQSTPLGTVLIGSRQSGEGKKEYTAMAEGGPTVFLIRDYLVTRLDKQAPDFLEKPTPTAAPGMPDVQAGGGEDADAEPADDEPLNDEDAVGGEQG